MLKLKYFGYIIAIIALILSLFFTFKSSFASNDPPLPPPPQTLTTGTYAVKGVEKYFDKLKILSISNDKKTFIGYFWKGDDPNTTLTYIKSLRKLDADLYNFIYTDSNTYYGYKWVNDFIFDPSTNTWETSSEGMIPDIN